MQGLTRILNFKITEKQKSEWIMILFATLLEINSRQTCCYQKLKYRSEKSDATISEDGFCCNYNARIDLTDHDSWFTMRLWIFTSTFLVIMSLFMKR